MFRPSSPYVPLWQAHQTSTKSLRYCTVQPRCVHTADTQWYSPSAVSSNNAGRLPNRKTFELFALRSPTLPATTSSSPRSGTAGGTRYFSTGYKKETTEANIPPLRRISTRRRLAGRTCWVSSVAMKSRFCVRTLAPFAVNQCFFATSRTKPTSCAICSLLSFPSYAGILFLPLVTIWVSSASLSF
jgi:hypothetical protein